MTSYWVWIILGVALGLTLVWQYFSVRDDKRRIEAHLQGKGATDISISLVWFAHDRDTHTYDVRYTLQGQPRQNGCKIRHWLWSEQDSYWKEPCSTAVSGAARG